MSRPRLKFSEWKPRPWSQDHTRSQDHITDNDDANGKSWTQTITPSQYCHSQVIIVV